MPLEKWSENVVVVHLMDDPQLTDDLRSLEQLTAQTPGGGGNAGGRRRVQAVLDFAAVTYINSSNIAKLLRLRKQMISNEARLLLCGINTQVWSAFLVTGLDKVFQFADNVTMGLTMVQLT